jgi:hypothetical protein
MTTEQAKQLSESALNRLMTALEQGHSAALKQYLAVMSRFRKYCRAFLAHRRGDRHSNVPEVFRTAPLG